MGNLNTAQRHKGPVPHLENYLIVQSDLSTKGVIMTTSVLWDDSDLLQRFADVQELCIEDEEDSLNDLPGNFYVMLERVSRISIRWSKIRDIGLPEYYNNLRHLSLTYNQLRDLYGIELLTKLRTLDVSCNKLRSLPDSIEELKNLFHLSASGNMLKALPESIGQLKSLRELLLSSNHLTYLPSAVCELHNLELLDVSRNKLMCLPAEIGNLTALEQLTVSDNKLTELPDSLEECFALKHLHISKNFISVIPETFGSLPLVTLIASNNRIVDVKAAMKQLKYLILDHNCLQAAPLALSECSNLEILSLNDNNVKNFEPLSKLSSLRVLHLRANDITSISDSICALTELRHLILNENIIRYLPDSIYKMSHLTLLKLDKRHLDHDWQTAYRQGINSVKEFARQRHLRSNGNNTSNHEHKRSSKAHDATTGPHEPHPCPERLVIQEEALSIMVCENNNYIV